MPPFHLLGVGLSRTPDCLWHLYYDTKLQAQGYQTMSHNPPTHRLHRLFALLACLKGDVRSVRQASMHVIQTVTLLLHPESPVERLLFIEHGADVKSLGIKCSITVLIRSDGGFADGQGLQQRPQQQPSLLEECHHSRPAAQPDPHGVSNKPWHKRLATNTPWPKAGY